jgi:hypothetical protein
MKRARALKTIRTFAVALPLGFGEPVDPEGAAPSVEALDPAGHAIAFVGAVLDETGEGRTCASVLVRPGTEAPRIGPAEWRADDRRSRRSEAIQLERKLDPGAAEGFEVWTGCAAASRSGAPGRVFVHLFDPSIAPGRRVIALDVDPGIWSWRSVPPLGPEPIDVGPLDSDADRTAVVVPARPAESGRSAAPGGRSGPSAPGP